MKTKDMVALQKALLDINSRRFVVLGIFHGRIGIVMDDCDIISSEDIAVIQTFFHGHVWTIEMVYRYRDAKFFISIDKKEVEDYLENWGSYTGAKSY